MNSPEQPSQTGPEDLRDYESVHGAEGIDDLYIAGPREAIKDVQNTEYPGSGEAGGGAYRYESGEQDTQPDDEEPSWKEKFEKHGGTRGWERTQRAVEQAREDSSISEETLVEDESEQPQPTTVSPESTSEPELGLESLPESNPQSESTSSPESDLSSNEGSEEEERDERLSLLQDWVRRMRNGLPEGLRRLINERRNDHQEESGEDSESKWKRWVAAAVGVAAIGAASFGIGQIEADEGEGGNVTGEQDRTEQGSDEETEGTIEPFIDTVGEGEGITHTIRDYIAEKHQVNLSADQYKQIWEGLTSQFNMEEIKAGFSGAEDMGVYGGAGFPEAGMQTEMSPGMQQAVEDIIEDMGWTS